MDGLNMNAGLARADAYSREAEQSRSNRNLKIADIKEQGKRDLTSAQDKLQSDRDHFLTADTLSGVESAYKMATSGAQTVNDWRSAKTYGEFASKQFDNSLASQIASPFKGVGSKVSSAVKSAGTSFTPSTLEGPEATASQNAGRVSSTAEQAGAGTSAGWGETAGAGITTPGTAPATSAPAFNAPTREAVATDVQSNLPSTSTASSAAEEEAQSLNQRLDSTLSSAKSALNNPLTKTAGKIMGNIQGGADIYDAFENPSTFDPTGPGGTAHHVAHILDSLGTVADVAGIFIPGSEELGAVLNTAGSISDSIGTSQQDKARVSGNASGTASKVDAVNPASIDPRLESAGLVASASNHLGNQSSVASF